MNGMIGSDLGFLEKALDRNPELRSLLWSLWDKVVLEEALLHPEP